MFNPTLKEDLELLDDVIKKERRRLNMREYNKAYQLKNKDKISLHKKVYALENRDKIKDYQKEYNLKNIDKIKEYNLKNIDKIKTRRKEYNKAYQLKNIDKIKEYHKEYHDNHKQEYKDYYLKNRNILIEKSMARQKFKLATDPFFRFKLKLRNLIRNGITKQGFSKTTKTANILGASFEEVRNHLEKQFKDGMTWNNHGLWEIDHKQPMSSAKTQEEAIKLNHYTNLQPLWKEENRKKSNKQDYNT